MRGMPECHLEIAALSDVGTLRDHNEDCCGTFIESGACAIVGVADGVSSSEGGEVASQMAIDVTLRAYREEAPARSVGQRLYNAVQQANIEIYERAYAIPELRGMSTTLTAVALEQGELTAVHVGDSRLGHPAGPRRSQWRRDPRNGARNCPSCTRMQPASMWVRASYLSQSRQIVKPNLSAVSQPSLAI